MNNSKSSKFERCTFCPDDVPTLCTNLVKLDGSLRFKAKHDPPKAIAMATSSRFRLSLPYLAKYTVVSEHNLRAGLYSA